MKPKKYSISRDSQKMSFHLSISDSVSPDFEFEALPYSHLFYFWSTTRKHLKRCCTNNLMAVLFSFFAVLVLNTTILSILGFWTTQFILISLVLSSLYNILVLYVFNRPHFNIENVSDSNITLTVKIPSIFLKFRDSQDFTAFQHLTDKDPISKFIVSKKK